MCFYSIFFFLNDTPPPNIPPPPPHPALPLSGEPAARRGAGARPARRKREQTRQVRLRVGMVFQQFNLLPHMTALENVMAGPLALPRRDQRLLAERLGGSDSVRALDRKACSARVREGPTRVGGGGKRGTGT